MDKKDLKLYIPTNLRIRWELINGIGVKELIYTCIALVISIIIGLIYNSIFNNFFGLMIIIFTITCFTFIIVMKDKNNQSVANVIKNIIKFYRNQRFFKYTTKEEKYYDQKK